MLIRNAEVPQRGRVDVRCGGGLIIEMGSALKHYEHEILINAQGGALLPGLHDHHMHFLALAAAAKSIVCGPPQVENALQLTERLSQSRGGEGDWLRGTGYHDSVAGPLNRWDVDRMVADRPVRIQHRSGQMWILNSCACELLQLQQYLGLDGVEIDDRGRVTGRLFRLDHWLRQLLLLCSPESAGVGLHDIAATSQLLASYGVTGVTDTTPTNSVDTLDIFLRATEKNLLLQKILVMGDQQLPSIEHPLLARGALKVHLNGHQLPEFGGLCESIAHCHRQGRPVAIHCVTRLELIFALTAINEAGHFPGDRIEHASLTEADDFILLREAEVTVVTQPGFIASRGDQYREDIPADEQPQLYRCRSLLQAGIPLAGSTDAPYGAPDPWCAMRAAVERTTEAGYILGDSEKLTPEEALALFTSAADAPGGRPRAIDLGEPADFCLLASPWTAARGRLASEDVAATIRDGQLIYRRRSLAP